MRKPTLLYPELATRRHPLPKNPDPETVRRVVEREQGRCICCGVDVLGERGWGWSIHHRRGRDRRPDSHSLANLVLLAGASNVDGCHGRVHQQSRSWSRPRGLWLSRAAGTDPLSVPLLLHGERFVYLTADGTYCDAPTEAVSA
jgi:hypothetical protein